MKPWQMMRRFGGQGSSSNPDWPWTALQVHFDATTDGGARFVDSSPARNVVDAFGDAPLVSGAARFGASGMRTSGAGQGMLVSDNAGIVVGTGDFCYSFRVKMASVSTEQVLLSTLTTDHGTDGFYIDYHPATYKLLHYSPLGGGLHYNAATGAMTAGAYQYVEYSRTAGVGYLSIDGHMVTSFADTNNYSSRVLFMGGITYTPVGAVPTAGDWDEFRLLVGKGGHTSDFTPPTSAFLDGP